jgi:hypothetical protein
MTNLLLQFPDLRPQDFRPWVNPDSAKQKNLSIEDYAAQQAGTWKKGLADWGQSGDRMRKMGQAADFVIYTPGSTAGVPVSILKSFDAPAKQVSEDEDLIRELVSTTASSLLGLVGIDADPVKSREHILLSNLLSHFWARGKSLTLASLIQSVQNPPFPKVGVFDVDSFFPSKERFGFAMTLNNLIASPSFQAWTEGEPFDAGGFLYTRSGKPKVSVFSIAHLSDAERMFFVSLLLNQVLGWMRTQSGTTSLRAILYFDELFGYMPPTANPPSKKPLLTLLKQGRAFGLGCVVATQNPVDLDYKGLSNAGTWFIGRLQTDRDRMRILDGLEGASAGKGEFRRSDFEKMIGGLGNRVFLLHNVHEDRPVVFQSRWALSYLAGPLTRAQIKDLVPESRGRASRPSESAATSAKAAAETSTSPNLDPKIQQFFFPVRGLASKGATLAYRPHAWGSATLHFADSTRSVDEVRKVRRIVPFSGGAVPVDWELGAEIDLDPKDLEKTGESDASFENPPPAAGDPKSYDAWKDAFGDFLARTERLELLKSETMKAVSKPGESERDFRARLLQSAREGRDARAEKLRAAYAKEIQTLQDQIRREELRLEKEKAQAKQQTLSTAISVGATILGAFLGRKAISTTTVTRAGTAARSATRTFEEAGDVRRVSETVGQLKQRLADLEAKFQDEMQGGGGSVLVNEAYEKIAVWPKKSSTVVELVALVWVPFYRGQDGTEKEAWR